MSEVDLERIGDAVRKEIALAPAVHSLTALRASDWRAKAAGDKPPDARLRWPGFAMWARGGSDTGEMGGTELSGGVTRWAKFAEPCTVKPSMKMAVRV